MIEFSLLCLQRHHMEGWLNQILPIVDSVHLDIMDGKFVLNHAFTPEFINKFDTYLPKHVHVMAFDPEHYLERLEGVTSFSFHLEAAPQPQPLLEEIRARGFKPGIVINPEMPVFRVKPYLPFVDRVVLMAVRPGFSAQKFIPTTSQKIIELRSMSPEVEIVIDGGMHEDTIREVMTLGADSCVVCSVIVKDKNPQQKVDELRSSVVLGSNNRRTLMQMMNGYVH